MKKSDREFDTNITEEERERLLKFKFSEEIQNETMKWLKRKFWIFTVIISIIVSIGIAAFIKALVDDKVDKEIDKAIEKRIEYSTAVINAALKNSITSTNKANREVENAKDALKSLDNARTNWENKLKLFTSRAKELESRSKELESEYELLEADIKNTQKGLKVQRENVQSQVDKIITALQKNQVQTIDVKDEKDNIEKFSNNASYRVLVFYVPEKQKEGEMIVAKLLDEGFKSSGMATDFSELGSYKDQHRSGDIWISYNEKGKTILDVIKNILESIDLSESGSSFLQSMKRGDLQVLVF